jgi:RNA 2',3'-cyclic 3'-phosphodiesterase
VRLFFAIELPSEVRAALARLRGDDGEYRWVDPSAMHVTLAFLGEQPESSLPALERLGASAASASSPAALELGQSGTFGPRSAPRVLWIGLGGDVPALLALHGRLTEALRNDGLPVEERPFSPHITLARRRETACSRPAWPPKNTPQHAFTIHELILFQSKLGPKGATYTALGRYELGG